MSLLSPWTPGLDKMDILVVINFQIQNHFLFLPCITIISLNRCIRMAAPLQSRTIGQGIEEIKESNLSFWQDSSRRNQNAVTGLMTIGNGKKNL